MIPTGCLEMVREASIIEDPIKRRKPVLGNNPDYSKALYVDPPSHDFCAWLMIAELMRRFRKADSPLRVRFLFQDGLLGKYDYGPYGVLSGKAYAGLNNLNYSNVMTTHVLRPAIEMIGGINEPDIHAPGYFWEVEDYCEYNYHLWQLVDASRNGFEIPKWKVPQWAKREVDDFLKGDYPVVITLREAEHQSPRNSNFEEWMKFAEYAQKWFPVIVIRDTALINFSLAFRTSWRASSNVFVRAALYERAFCNLASCGGPAVWFFYSDAPYLLFKQLVPELPDWDHGQEKGWREQSHLNIGDQMPWAGPHQRMTWKDDTFDNIKDEFEGFMQRRASTVA